MVQTWGLGSLHSVNASVSTGSWLAQAASSKVQARALGIRMGVSFESRNF
jgi:hypothetical protein